MLRAPTVFLIALPLALGAATSASASDMNPLGFYLGAGVGRTNVRTPIDPLIELDESDTGWKVVAGARPIRMLGAELEYVDFGHPRSTGNTGILIVQSNAYQRSTGLSGLVYLPIPLPRLDVYGRVGLARLESSGGARFTCKPGGPCPFVIVPPTAFSRTDTDLLYGAGLQVKLLSVVAVRLEYERINDHHGDPDMMSLDLTWTF